MFLENKQCLPFHFFTFNFRLHIMSVVLVVITMVTHIVSQTTLPLLLRPTALSITEPLTSFNLTKNSRTIFPKLNGHRNTSEKTFNAIGDDVFAELDSASVVDPLKTEEIATTTSEALTKKAPPAVPKVYRKVDQRKRKTENKTVAVHSDSTGVWKCPNITSARNLECGCDMPHTLRCSGDIHSLVVNISQLS